MQQDGRWVKRHETDKRQAALSELSCNNSPCGGIDSWG